MASYSISYTATSVTFKLTGTTAGETYRLFVRYAADTSSSVINDFQTASGTSLTRTYGGLSPSTNYKANAGLLVSGDPALGTDKTSWFGGENFTTPALRPSNWEWESTIAAGEPIRLTAGEWNGFCKRINEFRKYKGLSAYSFTTVSKGDLIRAATVNEARSAISAMYPSAQQGTVLAELTAAPGDTVTAEYFHKLRARLNAIFA